MAYFRKSWLIYLLIAVIFVLFVAGADKTVTTIVQNSPVIRYHTVIIDPGHGGIDGGATSCTGVLESQINLEISLKLRDLLHLLGLATEMIRTDDISVYTEGATIAAKKASDLRQRVKIVNSTENAILISIHQNTYSDPKYSGAQVFYAGTSGSQALARNLQQAIVHTLNPGSNRKEKEADHIYLMKHIQRTGVLVECGFLSNPEEEGKLRNETYQKAICCVIASVLSQYLHA